MRAHFIGTIPVQSEGLSFASTAVGAYIGFAIVLVLVGAILACHIFIETHGRRSDSRAARVYRFLRNVIHGIQQPWVKHGRI